MNTIKRLCVVCSILIFVAILVSGCGGPQSGDQKSDRGIKGEISISGAFALYPMTVRWAEEFRKEHPDVRIDISAGGAGKGMTDVLSGMVDLAMVSREISPEEVAQGAWFLAVTKDAVLPTFNTSNPGKSEILNTGLTPEAFQEIYLDDQPRAWKDYFAFPDGSAINVYTRSDACGAAEMWGKFLGKNQESLLGIGVFGDPGIADAVKNDVYGMGYNNVIYAYDISTRRKFKGMEIMPIDMNGDRVISPEENFYENLDSIMAAIRDGRYPSPPARDLYLVAKGKPENAAAVAFLQWILGPGQAFVNESGYVQLSEEKITHEAEKLN